MTDMPGPQFNEEASQKNWFSRHSQTIVLSLIVILLAIGGFYFYKSYQQRQALLRPALESLTNSASPTYQPNPSATSNPATPSTPKTVTIPQVNKQDSNYISIAAKGNGTTHLARQALKVYLSDKNDLASQLKAEQKIYIEDYLQKHVTHQNILKVGDQISFSTDLINQAINQAQKLSDKQIKNLHQYVLLAPSL